MKFLVPRDLFHTAINAVQRATATRVIQPILGNILINVTDDGRIQLSATDLDFSIETFIEGEVSEAGSTTLSAKKLSEIIGKLPTSSQVSVQVNAQTQTARIECGSSLFDMRTMPAEEYPLIAPVETDQALTLDLQALIRSIQQTAFAAASYETNNVLGGVFFKLSEKGLEMAATDGSRLARCQETLDTQGLTEEVTAIIPVKAVQEFSRLASSMSAADETVRVAIQDGQISFRTEQLHVVSRLLDGQYPPYGQLIPAENKIVALANRQALISALERTSVMANERTNVVKLGFDASGTLSLAANTPDLGDSQDSIDVDFKEADPLNIAFNYKFLLDALKVIESDDVRMETNGALAPTLFRSQTDEARDYLCLVMPVQVK